MEEAARIENQNAKRLLTEKKLSLILDLDQTIIHATVDPTVGEWMSDPDNPNFPALTDVHSFVLPDSPVVYYVKLREGTREFLKRMYELFELHIYTMGTRNYARAVAKVIDPDNSFFKDRILSRDESGTPLDDFFVGIGDINEPVYAASQIVAEMKENHSGASKSINPQAPKISLPTTLSAVSPGKLPSPVALSDHDRDMIVAAELEAEKEGEEAGSAKVLAQITVVHQHVLDEQQRSRPLALRQEQEAEQDALNGAMEVELEKILEASSADARVTQTFESLQQADLKEAKLDPFNNEKDDATINLLGNLQDESQNQALAAVLMDKVDLKAPDEPLLSPTKPLQQRRPVLLDNDKELTNVMNLLIDIHRQFYERKAQNIPSKPADVRVIMPEIKQKVFRGLHFVFSSIIPLGCDPQKHEIWKLSVQFGASCSTELTRHTTHLIAAKRGTAKTNQGRTVPGLFIVKPEWLYQSASKWRRLPETDFLLEPVFEGPPGSGVHDSHLESAKDPLMSDNLDDDILDEDLLIVQNASEEVATEVAARLGKEDWLLMDDEVDAVMNESDDDNEDEDDEGQGGLSDDAKVARIDRLGGGDEKDGESKEGGDSKEKEDDDNDMLDFLDEELDAVLAAEEQDTLLYSPARKLIEATV
ncbi:Carboxy-terminal domain (CTD) phosphatase [Chytridiales sp. JEL 0842]|nr:Carboxy-terminal domain (CTD) phosphatase [Chytridiales sp. JEL 0842]